jgi:hypothetical protein
MTEYFYYEEENFDPREPLAEGPLWEGLDAWLPEFNTEEL